MANYLCNQKCQSIEIDNEILLQCISFYVVSCQGLIAKQNATAKCLIALLSFLLAMQNLIVAS